MADQEISEYRVVEGPADESCHHGVSQSRAPLSQPKVRKILDTTHIASNFGDRLIAGLEELGRDFPEHAAKICITARKP
jgi:hypothetical protein